MTHSHLVYVEVDPDNVDKLCHAIKNTATGEQDYVQLPDFHGQHIVRFVRVERAVRMSDASAEHSSHDEEAR